MNFIIEVHPVSFSSDLDAMIDVTTWRSRIGSFVQRWKERTTVTQTGIQTSTGYFLFFFGKFSHL